MVRLDVVAYVVSLAVLFYGMVKSFAYYRKTKNFVFLLLLCVIIVLASELWVKAYGERLRTVFEEYRLLVSIVPLIIFLAYNHLQERRIEEAEGRQTVRKYFEKYVNPHVIKKLLDTRNLRLGGKKQEVTVLFSDLRGFTPLSEKSDPRQVVALLNRYYEAATKVILANDGTVDKFIGDAVMAVFNAPLEQQSHVAKAVKCAGEMRQAFRRLNAELKKEGLPALGVGIGIATGVAVIGNVGSQKAVNYTVIGDVVNTASRIQALAKKDEIVLTEEVFKQTGLKNAKKKLVKVKGKEKELVVYVV